MTKLIKILSTQNMTFRFSSDRFNLSSSRLFRSLVSKPTKEAKARIERLRPIFLSKFINSHPHYDVLRFHAIKAFFKKQNISNHDICSRKSTSVLLLDRQPPRT
jgi:hypothetical protein